MQEVTGSSPVPSTKTKARGRRPRVFVLPGHSRRGPVRVLYCCASEALPAAETAELEQGPRSDFCKPAATGAGKISKRNPTHQTSPRPQAPGFLFCPGIADADPFESCTAAQPSRVQRTKQARRSRGRALIFASPRRRAQEKSASATRPTKTSPRPQAPGFCFARA